eukprot:GHVS01040806.1.p1 GENE.GHVS01040806.1~~GHVS01040806.1.p1  ORF type:complete len:199 (-),score=14.75 GHVS01040806.1:233-829(-)
MGEPLANPRVFDALELFTSPEYFDFSQRRINISTIGVIPGIQTLTNKFPQVNLGFSLHTPFDDERNQLMPANSMYPLDAVFGALDERLCKSGRQIFLHYMLMAGQNDSIDHANALVDRIRSCNTTTRHLYHVNIQPFHSSPILNPSRFDKSPTASVGLFQDVLRKNGVSVSHGTSFGEAINAATGQLCADFDTAKSKT